MLKRTVLSTLHRFGYKLIRIPRDTYRIHSKVSSASVAELVKRTGDLASRAGSQAVFKGYVSPRRVSLYHEVVDVLERAGIDFTAKRIVDVGAFYGHFLLVMHSRHPEADYYGIECSDAGCAIASQLCPFATIAAGTISTIEQRYDILVCMEVLEHLAEPELAVRALADSADYVCVTIPDGRYDTTLANTYHADRDSYDGHVNFWSRESWPRWLRRNLPSHSIEAGQLATGHLYALISSQKKE
jgi:hypothetical protein